MRPRSWLRPKRCSGLGIDNNLSPLSLYGLFMSTSPRLPLTLIPRSCWEQNVRTALPERWDEIRHMVYRAARCEVCSGDSGGRPWNAHEYWDYRGGRQALTHIACLCDVCHATTHLGRLRTFSGSDQVAREALANLAKVNGWTVQQAAVYARDELDVCAERSRHKWTLDLSLLEREFGIRLPHDAARPRSAGSWLRQLLGVGP